MAEKAKRVRAPKRKADDSEEPKRRMRNLAMKKLTFDSYILEVMEEDGDEKSVASFAELRLFGKTLQPRLYTQDIWTEFMEARNSGERKEILERLTEQKTEEQSVVSEKLVQKSWQDSVEHLAKVSNKYVKMTSEEFQEMISKQYWSPGAIGYLRESIQKRVCTVLHNLQNQSKAGAKITAESFLQAYWQLVYQENAQELPMWSMAQYFIVLHEHCFTDMPTTVNLLPKWMDYRIDEDLQKDLKKMIYSAMVTDCFGSCPLDAESTTEQITRFCDSHRANNLMASLHAGLQVAAFFQDFEGLGDFGHNQMLADLVQTVYNSNRFILKPKKVDLGATPEVCQIDRKTFESSFKKYLRDALDSFDVQGFAALVPPRPVDATKTALELEKLDQKETAKKMREECTESAKLAGLLAKFGRSIRDKFVTDGIVNAEEFKEQYLLYLSWFNIATLAGREGLKQAVFFYNYVLKADTWPTLEHYAALHVFTQMPEQWLKGLHPKEPDFNKKTRKIAGQELPLHTA